MGPTVIVSEDADWAYVPLKELHPVEPESLPFAANTKVPAEGAAVAFAVDPLAEANEVSCHEVPVSDDVLGVRESTVAAALEESELQEDASRAAIVNGNAIKKDRRRLVNMQSAYVSATANQGHRSTHRWD